MGESFAGRRTVRLLAFAAGLGLAGTAVVWACADGGNAPVWRLAKKFYDPDGGSAMLSPSNDTRINLVLLMADASGTALSAKPGDDLLFPWKGVFSGAIPGPPAAEGEPSRCQSNDTGAADFIAAVQASDAIPPSEKAALAAARQSYHPGCEEGGNDMPALTGIASPVGLQFGQYLRGAAAFYQGDFAVAEASFAALGKARDGWLRGTSLYMVARSRLNAAQLSSFDEYGTLAEPAKRDQAGIAEAGEAFQAYLRAFPQGRYAASARGLMRRVHWLAGDDVSVAASFANLPAPSPIFVEEIDNKLLIQKAGLAARNPTLLAVVDLYRMRCNDYVQANPADCKDRIGRAELEAQRPFFAGQDDLYGFLLAAHAFYVEGQPRDVLRLIPDAARQRQFTYLQYSRQMLRGLALDATHDPNARAFWLSLFPGATRPYQRGPVELALASHEERNGGLARVFEQGSPIRQPAIRQLLLERSAGADILRQQAASPAASASERNLALYVLLGKQLRTGQYRQFLADARLVPANAPTDRYYWGAGERLAAPVTDVGDTVAPTGLFTARAPTGDAGCPALPQTVAQLAANAGAIRPRLCLAEYFRANGLDDYESFLPGDEAKGELGTAVTSLPDKGFDRLLLYRDIISSAAASADDKALALNRAIRCFEPSGYNGCGASDVPQGQRRAWFQQLKRDYPKSRWATSLKFYW